MKRYLSLCLLLSCLCPLLHAQDNPPTVLYEAAQCLATGKYEWVDATGLKTLQLAYHTDNKTYNGEHYIYVIVFTNPARNQGKVFDIRIKDHHTYSVENNARFVLGPNGGITFTEPPLGGAWTLNQLTARVHDILRHHKWYEADVKRLLKPSDHLQCETTVEDVVSPSTPNKQQ